MSFGKATVGVGTKDQREIDIKDFIQCQLKNNRLITVSSLVDDEGYILSVENPKSTGRAGQGIMWLSEESLFGLLATTMFYFHGKRINIDEKLKECMDNDEVRYNYSEGLEPLTP